LEAAARADSRPGVVHLDEYLVGVVRDERRPRLAERVQMFGSAVKPNPA
jgi:hypothetical protein